MCKRSNYNVGLHCIQSTDHSYVVISVLNKINIILYKETSLWWQDLQRLPTLESDSLVETFKLENAVLHSDSRTETVM